MNNFTFPKKMSRVLFTLLCALVVSLPVRMMGQNTLTVYDGGNNSTLVPYSYENRTAWQKCEFVIPASELSSMGATAQSPKIITDMTFYYSWYGYNTELCDFKVFVEEVGFNSFEGQSSFHGYNNATIVYEGRLNYNESKVKVSFDQNFVYHGGNLLIGMYTTRQWYYYDGSTYFYGTTVSNGALEGYDDDPENITPTIINFIPKTTFSYYDADYCFAPRWLEYDENSLTSTSVELDWTPRGSETAWGFEYSTDWGSTWTDCGVTANQHPYTLNNLQPGTEYYVHVYAKCGADNDSEGSEEAYIKTLYCDVEDQCELHYELRSSDGDWGWGWSYIEVYYMPNQEDYLYFDELTLGGRGTLLKGDLTVCDGGLFDFVWNVGDSEALQYISFVITDSYGNPLYDSSIDGVPTENGYLLENYEVQCPLCKKPRNLSVVTASTSASFTWTADSGHNSWELQYSTDEVNWSASQTVTGNPTGTVNSLDPATEYFVRVRANCGGGDYSPWAVISFYTDCATLVVDATHPFSEDFESIEPYDPWGQGGGEWKGLRMEAPVYRPLCWDSWNGSEDSEQMIYPYVYYDDYEVESNCLKFYVFNNVGQGAKLDQYAILPAIQDVGDLQMQFKAKTEDSYYSEIPFSVGVMTDPADTTTFVEIQSFEASPGYDDYVVYFGTYLGQGQYIAIKLGTPSGEWESYMIFVDDVVVSELPTCFVPSGFAVDTVGETTANLSWVPYGNETSWQVRYSTYQNTWTTVNHTEQNPGDTVTKQLTGLNANNLYYVQVRANCGNEDYSAWSAMRSFRTACGEYQAIPYYEDFESCSYENPLPQCWASINTTPTSGYPSYTNEPIYLPEDPSNNASLYFWCRGASLDLAQYAILPYMQDIQSLKMSFVAKGESDNAWNAYSSAFEVGVMTDPEDYTTFQTIMSQLDFHNATRYFTVYFDNYQGEGGYIAIKVPAETGTYKYLKVDNIAVEQVTYKPVTAYSNENPGWCLIASPMMGSISPESVDQMTNAEYDLYAFDQDADGEEWRNYKAQSFGLQNGKGYLYANSNNVTLGFAGGLQPAASMEVELDYTAGNSFAGWNLIGNPFDCLATLDGVADYYRINGNVLEVSSGDIEPCEGVFVRATASGQSVTFERADGIAQNNDETKGLLNLGLYGHSMNHRLDLVRIRFGEGDNLDKLNLLSDPNKLSIVLDGSEYAVVYGANQGVMPVNFKAAKDGNYTLAVDIEGVDMAYLHLIDNITGVETDLLKTSTYTFEAHQADYAYRFKLVFAINGEDGLTGSDDFAFFTNGNWVILNDGEATLQVIDMNGRILSSETINGSAQANMNVASGIYVIRLVDGDNVKVQKIVVQ